MFETRADVRYFLAQIARRVRAGEVEVHAYSVLTTHVHLFLRSPHGQLSHVMQTVLNAYVRWFNRVRGRDGPLFRGRFTSRHVDSDAYRRALVRYIDHNAVAARLIGTPEEYPHGSAAAHLRVKGPPWLERSWVSAAARPVSDAESAADAYRRVFGGPIADRDRKLVERGGGEAARQAAELDELLEAAPEQVLAWMRRKAAMADGIPIGLPVCSEAEVARVVAEARDRFEPTGVHLTNWAPIEVALRRELCGATYVSIAEQLGISHVHASRLHRTHRAQFQSDPRYAQTYACLGHRCVHGDVHTEPGSL